VTIRDWVAPSVGGLDLLRSPSRSTPWKGLQRLTLSGDSVEAVQPDELQGTVRPCRRNGRPSVNHVRWGIRQRRRMSSWQGGSPGRCAAAGFRYEPLSLPLLSQARSSERR
jgi:hypothetical protein